MCNPTVTSMRPPPSGYTSAQTVVRRAPSRPRAVAPLIGGVGTALCGAGINIASYHQARRAPGEEALAAINVDQALKNGVLEELQRLPDVLDVRLAYVGD